VATGPAADVLVERERELEQIQAAVVDLRAGRGSLVLLEAPAGHGKTALLRALRDEAARAGARALTANAAELERDFAFGIVRQLFEPELRDAGEPRCARLFRDAAGLARAILVAGPSTAAATDPSHPRLHGLFWLTANLADEQPLLVVVDDIHWADAPSLRFLDMLARRLEDIAVVLAIAARPHEPGAEEQILTSLASAPSARLLRPGALSHGAVRHIVRSRLGADARGDFVDACFEVTAGNPLLLTELLAALARDGPSQEHDADRVRAAAPRNVSRAVVARLRRLSPAALAFARALAVLGDGSPASRVAALAGISCDQALDEHVGLARVGLLEPDGLRFVHPLVLTAVRADLVGGERSRWHRHAARLLADDGARAEEVAIHLLQTSPAGDAWTARALTDAGRRALRDGAPDVAQRLLRRALIEPPAVDHRPAVLLELGLAEAAAGTEDALDHLEEAASTGAPCLAARAERARSGMLFMSARAGEALHAVERAVALADDPETMAQLGDDLLYARHYAGLALADQVPLLERAAGEGRTAALAHHAMVEAIRGAPAAAVVELARLALADGELIRAGVDRQPPFHAIQALVMVDAADEAATAIELAAGAARRSGSRYAIACVAGARTHWEHAYGDLRRAEDDARLVIDVFRATAGPGGSDDAGVLALADALLDRGRVADAERALADLPAEWGPAARNRWLRGSSLRARLRFVQGRAREALPELQAHLRDDVARGRAITARDRIRSTLVEALAALGRRAEALDLAEQQLAVARRRGLPTAEGRLLLARARAVEASLRVAALEEAVAVARRSPSRLLRAEALAELGATLRRAGERVAARAALREARELAHLCGATGLQERAHDDLLVAGGRPRRVALSGVDALTASERRAADLAARGLRNREIAQALFVTIKTVEVHLGHAYAKLGVRGRSQLVEALDGR
jgi:DNA-binding CsgD family transcriptional regulator